MLPLFLDLKGRRVVVFGGGEVGLRKAKYFAVEGDVIVVSHSFVKGFDDTKIKRVYDDAIMSLDKWVRWADIVIAATDDNQVNDQIVQKAIMERRFVNSAEGTSTFYIPSVIQRDNFVVAVSTLGQSPAMAKYLRKKLDAALPDEYSRMVSFQKEMRSWAKEHVPDQKKRELFLWDILEDEGIWTHLRQGNMRKAKQLAQARMVNEIGRHP